jgi:hypothetical protein
VLSFTNVVHETTIAETAKRPGPEHELAPKCRTRLRPLPTFPRAAVPTDNRAQHKVVT